MVKLSFFFSYGIAYLYVLTGALAIASSVVGNILMLPFAVIMLIYGITWVKFCLITKEHTINYYSYRNVSSDFTRIPFKQGKSIKRFSIILIFLALAGTLLTLSFGYTEFNAWFKSLNTIKNTEKNHLSLVFLASIFALLHAFNLHYSISVYRSISWK